MSSKLANSSSKIEIILTIQLQLQEDSNMNKEQNEIKLTEVQLQDTQIVSKEQEEEFQNKQFFHTNNKANKYNNIFCYSKEDEKELQKHKRAAVCPFCNELNILDRAKEPRNKDGLLVTIDYNTAFRVHQYQRCGYCGKIIPLLISDYREIEEFNEEIKLLSNM